MGKTALVNRYVQDFFTESYAPTIERKQQRQVIIDNISMKLQIIDTAGPEDWS